MSWVLLMLLAVNLLAINNIINKYIVSIHVRNPLVTLGIMSVPTFILSAALIAYAGISAPDPLYLAASFLLGVLFFFSANMYFSALNRDEVSRVIPLLGIMPVFTLTLATIFLGEIFSAGKYLGIAMLVAGSFLISYRHANHSTGSKGFSAAAPYALACALSLAVYYTSVKFLSLSMNILVIFALAQLGFASASFFFLLRNKAKIKNIYDRNKKAVFFIFLTRTFGFAAFLVYFTAISQGPVSLVNALGNLESFLVLLYATLVSVYKPGIFREEIRGPVLALKLLAIIIIFAGAYLISV